MGSVVNRLIACALGLLAFCTFQMLIVSSKFRPEIAMEQTQRQGISGMSEQELGRDHDPSLVTDSSTATVISFAFGYALHDFKQFVGSLRATGYMGHIILGVSPDTSPEVLSYLKQQNVIPKFLYHVPCTHGYNLTDSNESTRKSLNTCIFPYSDIKMRWSKYPLAHDWLQQCQTCVGPVLLSDFRDLVFQRDPFLGERINGLQVFEEHPDLDNTHWLTYHMILPCKGIKFPPTPTLCSGTTVGTRAAMLDYLTKMHNEMKLWIATKSCHLESDADDQAMHNYLFYFKNHSNALKNAKAVPHQTGIVNTIGYQAARVWERNEKRFGKRDQLTAEEKAKMDYTLETDNKKTWLKQNLTDSEGYFVKVDGQKSRWEKPYLTDEQGLFVNLDGTISRVIHQIDRFGPPLSEWLDRKPFMTSKVPSKTVMEQPQRQDSSKMFKRPKQGKAGEVDSLVFLFDRLADMTVFDAEVVPEAEEERCARYGWTLRSPPVRRRIFRGSLIADDSWHPIAITAMEGFGLYHHVAFAESNRTHSYVPRGWRFANGSDGLALLQNGMFGPDTSVSMDYYIDEDINNLKAGHLYENLQRDVLLRRWREEGMTVDDIGLIADTDESFTRDFLRAVQICDVPEFRSDQSCQKPKLLASALVFEGSFNCLTRQRWWHHPDLIIGKCIELIGGDENKNAPVPPDKRDSWGLRQKGFNPDDKELQNATAFPLWNGADFRQTAGGEMAYGVNGENTGFHVHNFFMSEAALRFKYGTYSHPRGEEANNMDLELLDDDVKLMLKCIDNVTDAGDINGSRRISIRTGVSFCHWLLL